MYYINKTIEYAQVLIKCTARRRKDSNDVAINQEYSIQEKEELHKERHGAVRKMWT